MTPRLYDRIEIDVGDHLERREGENCGRRVEVLAVSPTGAWQYLDLVTGKTRRVVVAPWTNRWQKVTPEPTAVSTEPPAPRSLVFEAKRKTRDALGLMPSKSASTDGLVRAAVLLREAAERLEAEVVARAQDTARRRAGYDPAAVLYDKLGRKRSPATIPGFMAGRAAPSKGRKYPPNPFSVEEIVALTNQVAAVSKNDIYAQRLLAVVLVLWRSGLRISEALLLGEGDLKASTSEIFVRRGKGGKPRTVGVDQWLWQLLRPWDEHRADLPSGPYFCVVEGKTAGVDPWGASQVRAKFAALQAAAKIRKRFRPHQLRHTLTCELVLEGTNIVIVQRQLGHANLAVTTHYTNGLPQAQVVDAMRGRKMPVLPAFGGGS